MRSCALGCPVSGTLSLEAFASVNGARFYDLPVNEDLVMLERWAVEVPEEIDGLVPFRAGETLRWRLVA